MQVKAYAKINWCLNITELRDDGYHELDMLMQSIALHDTLSILPSKELRLTMDGQAAEESNLVLRAARALNAYCGTNHGAEMALTKAIPSRAGLGGGSADCGAALKALNTFWDLRLKDDALLHIGTKLGADVPFCTFGGLSRVQGIGEKLTPIRGAQSFPLVLVTPGGGLSTKEVFSAWDASPSHAPEGFCVEKVQSALQRADFADLQKASFNALEKSAAAMMPKIAETMSQLKAYGACFVRMSGSGSTVYGVFENGQSARDAAEKISGALLTRTLAEGEFA